MLGTLTKTIIFGLTFITSTAFAFDRREPVNPQSVRETTASLHTYNNEVKIVRDRSEGKAFATFHADPQLIDENSVLVFEIKSYAKTGSLSRWRCIATHDIAECLGAPVRIQYLPRDTRIELSFKLKPKLARENKQAYAQN